MKLILVGFLILFGAQEVSSIPIHSQQEKLTPEETQAVQDTANLFVQRLEETGDFTALVKELYTRDFIQGYITQKQKELAATNSQSKEIFFAPGLDCNTDLLIQATADDWQRFYIAVNNILGYGIMVGMNRSASAILKGEEPNDDILNHIIPPQVVKLFNQHPILKNFVMKKGASKSIETVEEMRSVVTTLEQAVVLLQKEPCKLTEESKKVIELLKATFSKEMPAEVIENGIYGYPQGTRVFAVHTPLLYSLYIVRIGDKYQIVWAEPVSD